MWPSLSGGDCEARSTESCLGIVRRQLRARPAHVAQRALVIDVEATAEVDEEAAWPFLDFEADRMHRWMHEFENDWTQGYRTYLRYCLVQPGKGRSHLIDSILRRSQWRQRPTARRAELRALRHRLTVSSSSDRRSFSMQRRMGRPVQPMAPRVQSINLGANFGCSCTTGPGRAAQHVRHRERSDGYDGLGPPLHSGTPALPRQVQLTPPLVKSPGALPLCPSLFPAQVRFTNDRATPRPRVLLESPSPSLLRCHPAAPLFELT